MAREVVHTSLCWLGTKRYMGTERLVYVCTCVVVVDVAIFVLFGVSSIGRMECAVAGFRIECHRSTIAPLQMRSGQLRWK